MKMFNVNTRAIASFVLAIFLTSISVVLIAWACDSYKRAVEDRERDVKDAKAKVKSIEDKGIVSYVTSSATQGAVEGGATGLVAGLYVGGSSSPVTGGVSMPLAVGVGVGVGVTSGYAGGAVGGAFDYYNELSDANDNLDYYERQLAEAKEKLEICLNPPAKYTFTEPSSGYVWEFCATMYGSDSNAYTAYMEFLEKRGFQ